MAPTNRISRAGIYRLAVRTTPSRYPQVKRVVGQNAYLLGKGNYGGKAKGLLMLGSQNYPVQPFVSLQTCWLKGESDNGVRELSGSDIETVYQALSLVGFTSGPLAVRSDHFYESMGIVFQSPRKFDRLATPAGLLGTQIILHDPALPGAELRLAKAIREVCLSSQNPDFVAFMDKYHFKPRPSSVILQPFLTTTNPANANLGHPFYSAIVDTARQDMVRVCAGYGAGTLAISARGQGFVHRFDLDLNPLEEQARGGQSHFDALDETGRLGRFDFDDFFSYRQIQELRTFFRDPNNFVGLARLGLEMTRLHPKGVAICLEAAAANQDSEPKLLQLNPIRKMKIDFPRPEAAAENILYETSSVIGQGTRKLKGAVAVIVPKMNERAVNLHKQLEQANQEMTDYLLVIPGLLTSQGLGTAIPYRLFSNAAAVFEYASDIHETGTGMDHFTRICNTGGIYYFESMFMSFSDLRSQLAQQLPALSQIFSPGVHRIPADNLHLWVNEEADNGRGDGLIYRSNG